MSTAWSDAIVRSPCDCSARGDDSRVRSVGRTDAVRLDSGKLSTWRLSLHRVVNRALAAAVWVAFFAMLSPSGMGQQPNIVFVMVDDMGFGELGVTGQLDRAANGLTHIKTPHIDALANTGILMTNFYATPICASSRGSLLTGFHNGHSSIDRNGGNNGGNALRAEDITFGETLQSAGYTTGAFGKWGVGGFDHIVAGVNEHDSNTAVINFPAATPAAQGFDEFYGYLNQVRAHDYYETYQWEHDGNGGMRVDTTDPTVYSADLIADRSLDFISSHANSGSPFLMYGAYTIPHSQFDPPNDAILQSFLDAGYGQAEAKYAAMMMRLDNTMGAIVARLKDPNQDGVPDDSVYDDTLILFTSDNGGTGTENTYFGGDAGFRSTKSSVYEGGVRAPLVAHWHGTIAPGQIDDTSIGGIDDMFATFNRLAGIDSPVGVDSADLSGLFTGEAIEQRHFRIFEARNKGDYSIRMGDYKLVNLGGASQLYDVVADPGESNNLAADHPEVTNLLQQIALDEGARSDAGSGTGQTTFFAQYKTWTPVGASVQWGVDANWSGGTELNTRGTAATNYDSGPASNWVVAVRNATATAQETVVESDSTVLGLEVEGGGAPVSVRIASGQSLQARNGVRIQSGGTVELDGANLETLRTIDIRQGGTLKGAGSIRSGYDTSMTPFDLPVTLRNGGTLEISTPSPSGTERIDVLTNGGFELGAGFAFAGVDGWDNHGGDATRNARNTTSPAEGAYRGIVGISGDGVPISPSQETPRAIALGDEFSLEFEYAGAFGWNLGTDQFQAVVFYDDNGTETVLHSATITPTQAFGTGYDSHASVLDPITDANAVGKELQLRFESLGGTGEFASIDSITLTTVEAVASSSILHLDGNYIQSGEGVLAIGVHGEGQVAGVDHGQLAITGTADLSGELAITIDPDLSLELMQPLEIITAESGITGKFSRISGVRQDAGWAWAVTYSADAVAITPALPGDADLDGDVDDVDFDIWNAHRFSTETTCWRSADFNGDGFTDVSDFNIWNAHRGLTASVSSVPEPSSLVMFLTGLLLLWRRPLRGG